MESISKPPAAQKASAKGAQQTRQPTGPESSDLPEEQTDEPSAAKPARPDKVSNVTLEAALERAGSETARQVLLESVRYSGIRRAGEPAVVGAASMTRAAVLVGLDLKRTPESAPRWLADWLRARSHADQIRAWTDRPVRTDRAPETILLSNNAVAALDRAVDFTERTVGRSRFDGRHLVAGLLASPPGLRQAVARSFVRRLGVDLRDFLPDLFDYVTNRERQEPNENNEAWRTILLGDAAHVRFLPDYAADRPDGTMPDTLGIAAEVQAFAELICLEAARPPLSIGLFGEWGSGKTFFMEKLQHAIRDICAGARRGAGGGHFIENAVQVRFNAWHYNDANLWACLTAEVFDQLRAGGHAGMPGAAYDRLVGDVAEHVCRLESEINRAEKEAAQVAVEVREKEAEVRQAREALEGAAADLAPASGGEVRKAFRERSAALKKLGDRLHGEDLSNDVRAFAAAAQESASFTGKVRLIASALLLRWPAMLLVAAAVFTTAFIALWDLLTGNGWIAFFTRFIALGGGLFTGAAAFWQAYEAVRPVLDGATAFLKDLREEHARLAADLRTKQMALDDAVEREKQVRGRLAGVGKQHSPFAGGGQSPSQAMLLRYFLFEDSETRDFSEHVGLISRARRSFETLDMLLRREREARAADRRAAAARERGGEPDRQDVLSSADADGVRNAPDRIILYIDDLDRCSHEQVYDVLQAVHLLLAFESFVVVVGVDVRWVELALASHMGLHGMRNGNDSLGQEAGNLSRSRSVDYLEKIFQIPFWLKPLDAEATYRAYVAGLLGGTKATTIIEPATKAVVSPASSQSQEDDVDPDFDGAEDHTVAVPVSAETFSPVVLGETEIAFLTSPIIGRIAGTSPRAVRRFVNLYRLVRAQRRGPALDRFTGESDGKPDFPILAFLLALESGQPSTVVHSFYRALDALPDGENVIKALSGVTDSVENTDGLQAIREALGEALKEVERVRSSPARVSDFRGLATESRRYTFHRFG